MGNIGLIRSSTERTLQTWTAETNHLRDREDSGSHTEESGRYMDCRQLIDREDVGEVHQQQHHKTRYQHQVGDSCDCR